MLPQMKSGFKEILSAAPQFVQFLVLLASIESRVYEEG